MSGLAREIALRRESARLSSQEQPTDISGEESPSAHATQATVPRSLRSRAAGSDLAALDHKPERRLRRQRQSLSDRLELVEEEQPIVQDSHEQQIQLRGPEALGEAWVCE